MKVKTKKKHLNRVIRIEGDGEIKEVLINADLKSPEKRLISICFIGRDASGIVELSEKEAEDLGKTLTTQAKLLKNKKILSGKF